MRLMELRLMAYGPFTDETLKLAEQGPAIDLIYGPNEAGKSSALRAITGLFYGIDARTSDDHVHDKPKLRIGAKLRRDSGEIIEVVRRKGSKNTLLTPDEAVIDEALMQAALAGVSRELFLTMFGLDDKTLEAAAEALLAGGGSVGESLFDAGGARGVGNVLEQLRAEADALFKARGQNQPLNAALRQLKEAKEALKLKDLRPKAWTEQNEALEEAKREHAEVQQKRQALAAEKSRLSRVKKALPHLARRRELLRQAREPINVALALIDDDMIESLRSGLDRTRSAVNDLPKLEGRLRADEEDAEQLLRELGRALPLGEAEELLIDRQQQTHIQTLTSARATAEQAWETLREHTARARSAVKAASAQLAELGPEAKLDGLRAAIKRAVRAGDVDAQLEQAASAAEQLGEQVAQRQAALALEGAADDAVMLPVPSDETVQTHRDASQRHEQALKDVVARIDEQQRRLDGVDKEIEALERAASVPDEAHLKQARQQRDALYGELKGKRSKTKEADYEAAVVESDSIADRMWREADRVAQRARLGVEREYAAAALDKRKAARSELEATGKQATRDWRALWKPLGIDARSPREMLAWLDKHAELVALVEQAREARRTAERLSTERETLCVELAKALAAVGHASSKGERLGPLLDAAELLLAELGSREEERRTLTAQLVGKRAEVERLDGELALKTRARDHHRDQWAKCMASLGLAEDASVELANAYLAGLSDLRAKLRDVVATRRRVEGIARDREQFDADVRALAERVGVEVEDTVVAAEIIVRRAAEQRAIDEELRSKEAQLLELGEGADIEQLEAMAREADVDAINARLEQLGDELEDVEDDAVRLNRSIGSTEAQLKEWDKREGAYAAAGDVQSSLASIRNLAERYARTRLAALLLEQEIERYRKANEGPVVRRARELFEQLTLGRYRELRAEYHAGDEPELRCIRHDGGDVGVAGLSDGTRDQLYLALRLASLERYAEQAEVVPFVADDLLNRFDHERKRAALEVLYRFSQTTQVLFFTHELPLVELAREVLPAAGLREHQLGAKRLTRASGRASMPAL